MTEFTPLAKALINLTLANPSADEARVVREGLSAPTTDLAGLWPVVDHNDVAPLVALQLERLGLWSLIPAPIQVRLATRRAEIEAANAARMVTAARFFAACRARNVPVVVLKGVLFGTTVYRAPGYKKMNDVDILVRFEDVAAIRQIYTELDLVPLALLEGGADELDQHKSHHLPAYVSTDLTFVVGTHWFLVSPKAGYQLEHEGMWNRARQMTIAGETVLMLSERDNLHHLVVHFHYYKTGLKELADVANLIRSVPSFEWGLWVEEMAAAQAHTPAYRVLRLVEALYGPLIPSAVLDVCRAGAEPFVVEDTDRLATRGSVLLMSRSTWSSEIEKAYLSFTYESRFVPKVGALARFWRRLVLPPRDVLYRTNACLPGECSLRWLFLVNLWRTAREVGKGFGMAVFVLLMAKSLYSLAAALCPFRRDESAEAMAALRARFGNDEARLRKLLTMME